MRRGLCLSSLSHSSDWCVAVMIDLLERSPICNRGLWSSVIGLNLGVLYFPHFAGRPDVGNVLVVPHFFYCHNDGGHCALGNLRCSRRSLYPSTDPCLDPFLSLSSGGRWLNVTVWFHSDTIVTCETLHSVLPTPVHTFELIRTFSKV